MKHIETDVNHNTNINVWFEIDGETWGASYDRSSHDSNDELSLIDCDGMPVDLPDGEQSAMLDSMDRYVKEHNLLEKK